MRKIFTCIVCPEGCALSVEEGEGGLFVTGNKCARGKEYGKTEFLDPRRVVTSCVAMAGTRLPVKTKSPVRKADIDEVLRRIHEERVVPPIKIGEVIVENVAGTGVDVVATANRN